MSDAFPLPTDAVLFSVDYPYEDTKLASEWIEGAAITDEQRSKICSGNATRVLRLG
jgi:2,3-dihydroxybenzoate decarboxylase